MCDEQVLDELDVLLVVLDHEDAGGHACRVGEGAEPGAGDVVAGEAVQGVGGVGDVGVGAVHEFELSGGGCVASFRVWDQATVAPIAMGSGVALVPNADSYLVVSSAKGWSPLKAGLRRLRL